MLVTMRMMVTMRIMATMQMMDDGDDADMPVLVEVSGVAVWLSEGRPRSCMHSRRPTPSLFKTRCNLLASQ